MITKPKLSFWQIWNMNVGFFGIQFSFGLQQSAVNPIFEFLGAHHDELPLLNLAGPVTGLLIQPIIGAISDKTWSPKYGRRKPFFLIGAILASLCLLAFPFSPELWFAVGLLWILDAANNTAMEPYRAFVGDKLPDNQLTFGYQMQSLFVGAGITIANFSLFLFQGWFSDSGGNETLHAIPTWVYYSFFLGAIASIGTVLWSVMKTPEIPPSEEELKEIEKFNEGKPHPFIQVLSALFIVLSAPLLLGLGFAYLFPYLFVNFNLLVVIMLGIAFMWLYFLYRLIKKNPENDTFRKFGDLLMPLLEAAEAIADMPKFMWKLSGVYFFQWYALFIYWQFISPMLKHSISGNSDSDALAQVGLMNGTYNFVTMIVALALVPLASKFGSKKVYVLSLFLSALSMLSLPFIQHQYLLLIPMILLGIGWAAMMGIPYAMVSKVIPATRRGVYMGIVNMMIVIPMLIETVSFGPIVKYALNDSPINAIVFAGVFFAISGVLALRLKEPKDSEKGIEVPPIAGH
ncbi:maltose/moltooligosaccharide transporter [Tenacibaculum sp. MAR_2009_124]|uniref:MFS transporter n=1 Tax=Tenacibaculum sp. MAR_2009_124 TaxID=1250059 RepID=UPI000899EC84|nr:MFS transporter [Tenacibaculum sp. MAR_2009_124]SEC19389.1 maltose/moltooligosaccharide transporter [Tenacibaculum sp. MAR_2009_124]